MVSRYSVRTPRAATLVVAASDSSTKSRQAADYRCNGTDDHVEIQAALDALPANGGEVMLMEGTFYIGVRITPDSNQTLRGQGANTCLKASAGIDIIYVLGGHGTEKTGITISDLCLDGNSGTNNEAIFFTWTDDSFIRNVWVVNSDKSAVFLNRCDRVSIADCFFDDCDGEVLDLSTCLDCTISGCWITNSFFTSIANSDRIIVTGNHFYNGNNGFNIKLISSDECVIANNVLDTSDYNGIKSTGNRCQFTNNLIVNAVEKGIWVNGHHNIIDGNTIYNCGTEGIYADSSNHNIISNNIVFGNSQDADDTSDGIFLTASDYNLIADNIVRRGESTNKQRYGINVSNSTCDGNKVTGNHLYDSGSTAPINNAGTNTTFDLSVHSGNLDLSGSATDLVTFFAECLCQLVGYSILYTEASSADTGVNIRVGRYQDGVALDDDYFDISTSEVSKNLGYAKHFGTADLTQILLAAGDTMTVGIVGGKSGAGEVKLILQMANMAS